MESMDCHYIYETRVSQNLFLRYDYPLLTDLFSLLKSLVSIKANPLHGTRDRYQRYDCHPPKSYAAVFGKQISSKSHQPLPCTSGVALYPVHSLIFASHCTSSSLPCTLRLFASLMETSHFLFSLHQLSFCYVLSESLSIPFTIIAIKLLSCCRINEYYNNYT